VQDIISKFKFRNQLEIFESTGITFALMEKFCNPKLELSPEKISPMAMGYMFEDLIRRFNEKTNAAAGRHFTPREIIELMTHLVYLPVKEEIKQGTFLVYDPCAGSGAMLTQSKKYATDEEGEVKSKAVFHLYGQENTGEMYATCKSDMLLKGEDPDKIKFGSTLSEYGFDANLKFNFMLTNPPYGTTWKQDMDNLNVGTKTKIEIIDSRFNLPVRNFKGKTESTCLTSRSNDGQLMFMLHMLAKMKAVEDGGSRIASVHNGSALFTGDAGSSESGIRQYIIENDLLECIVQLPNDIFYNTGIATYVWIISNKKAKSRQGKVQLINASSERFYKKMRKSLGSKRNQLTTEHIEKIQDLYFDFEENEYSKIFDNSSFGYYKIKVSQPMRDEKGKIIKDSKGKPKADKTLNDTENVPMKNGNAIETINEYFQKEVVPFAADAWYDKTNIKVGYEIAFNKYFYQYEALRPLSDIAADILALEQETEHLLKEIVQ
jgi:type I restriction enzyme M protein